MPEGPFCQIGAHLYFCSHILIGDKFIKSKLKCCGSIIQGFIPSVKGIYFVIYGIISEFTDKGQFQYITNL